MIERMCSNTQKLLFEFDMIYDINSSRLANFESFFFLAKTKQWDNSLCGRPKLYVSRDNLWKPVVNVHDRTNSLRCCLFSWLQFFKSIESFMYAGMHVSNRFHRHIYTFIMIYSIFIYIFCYEYDMFGKQFLNIWSI